MGDGINGVSLYWFRLELSCQWINLHEMPNSWHLPKSDCVQSKLDICKCRAGYNVKYTNKPVWMQNPVSCVPFFILSLSILKESCDVLYLLSQCCAYLGLQTIQIKGLNKGDSPLLPFRLPPYFERLRELCATSPGVRSISKPFITALSSDNAMQMRNAT